MDAFIAPTPMTSPTSPLAPPPPDLVIHRFSAAVAAPWRNGGGITRELVRVPSRGDFAFRVSVADVAADGPFSAFAGYDRIVVLLSGAGMDLHFEDDGTTVVLRPPWGSHRFAGERPVKATLVDGATTDFNLMWRRDAMHVAFEEVAIETRREVGAPDPTVTNAVFVAAGAVRLGDGTALGVGDVAVFRGSVACEGEAMLLWCSLASVEP